MSERNLTRTDDLLTQLATLDGQDRTWLVSRLSSKQRAALMDLARAEPAAAATSESNAAAHETPAAQADELSDAWYALRHARPEEIVALLADEPAWLVQALVSLDDWRWRSEVEQQLHSVLRPAGLHAVARPLPVRMRDALVRQCAAQLPRFGTVRPRSKRQRLLSRFATFLVERRLSLHA